MRIPIAIFLAILTFVGILYTGIWWGIVEPVWTLIEADPITVDLALKSLLQFLIREILTAGIFFLGIALIGLTLSKKYKPSK